MSQSEARRNVLNSRPGRGTLSFAHVSSDVFVVVQNRQAVLSAPSSTIGHVDVVPSYYKPSLPGGFCLGMSEDRVIPEDAILKWFLVHSAAC